MTRTHYYTPTTPPTSSAITFRQISSIPIIILLWTAAVPFSPTAWLIGNIEGASLIDRFVAAIILLCALYFQFKLSGLSHPVAVALSNPIAQGSDSYVSNGRMGGSRAKRDAEEKAEVVFYYHPGSYWTYVVTEVGLLVIAEFGRMEYLRRAIVLCVVAGLWAVGWMITPRSTKMWAWEHIKAFWFFIVLDLVREIGFGGGRHRRRR
ncbi:hypothetical protein CC78DRAFT_530620 [Lojkania enalia]|uniref:Uncharacterized protein n=1 Tax=Lojkania enalia TaxID=147567 RepID=A0A9P4N809_9PLEO|nr:hypothetical protein CC78DRAFT_530620 [Didymosphaeria enalia]